MLLLLITAAFIVQTSLAQCLTSQDDRPSKGQEALGKLVRSQLDFSLNLFKAIGSAEPSENVFISPLSIYNAMLLAYFVSAGRTEYSLQKLLFNTTNEDKLNLLYSYRLQKILSSDEDYKTQVNSANHLFISVNQTVQDCMYDIFADEIDVLDFGRKGLSHAVDRINGWVANQTKNNIQNLLSANAVNPGTQLILANIAYFKGLWINQFDPLDTRLAMFHVNKQKSVQVPMMFQQNTFRNWRSDKLSADVLELPYKGVQVSLILLLPDPTNSVAALLRALDSDTVLTIVKQTSDAKNEEKVEISLPKFTVEKTLELTPILERLGVGDLFSPTSNLTGLTGGPRIRLTSAIHKAKIQVEELGTEAAAATALTDTRIPPDAFMCDRPFVYILFDKDKENLLFAGILNDPSK